MRYEDDYERLTDSEIEEYEKLLKQESAYQNFKDYIEYTMPNYDFNWHHEVLIDILQSLIYTQNRRIMVFMPPRFGKAISHKEVVYTPEGHTFHGMLEVGSKVFHPSGKPVTVVAVSEDVPCDVELTFSNGQKIVCHKNHEWKIFDRSSKQYKVVEAKWFFKRKLSCGVIGKRGGRYTFQIDPHKALEFNGDKEDFNPYLAGACISKSTSPSIYRLLENSDTPPWEFFIYNKLEHKLQFLAGLIDNTGYVDANGRVTIIVGCKEIKDSIVEFLETLALRPCVYTEEDEASYLHGYYLIKFQPTFPISTEKPNKQISRFIKQRRLAVVSVKRVEPQQGKCIQVDSEDGLYLVGEKPVTTHNSELVSRRFPSWLLGRKPDTRIMGCSYSSGLATMFSRDVQRIMETEKYAEIFPDTMLPNTERARSHPDNNKYKRTNTYFEVIGFMGYLLSVGVGGSITGLGADILIIDDPVKNEEEALSETYREKIFGWYNSTAYTRLEKGANVIICQTRWHKQDLSGKLIEEMEYGGDKWEIINFPALATELKGVKDPRKVGEPLWPNKYPLDRMEAIKKQVGSRVWSALYQQNPVIEGGNIIKEDWIQYYTHLTFDITNWRECYIVQSWDLTFKDTGKSWVVGVAIAKKGADYYLIDIFRQKADFTKTKEAIKAMADRYPMSKAILIEDKANGSAIISSLKETVSYIIPVQATASKDERLHAVSPIFEAGNFFLPANHPKNKEIVEELTSFPNGGTDDIVDAISQALIRFQEMRGLRHLINVTQW